ncbi:hypothetical protein FRB90_004606 [Tulasnella sp. 427]|nr:hypothetical protein FRB90_004606 [Tulasnella sp. 427]
MAFSGPGQSENESSYEFTIHKTSELNSFEKRRVWEIFEKNMRDCYVGSSFGWDTRSKRKELFHADARFILVRKAETPKPVIAYTVFRFEQEGTVDDDVMDPVVYCYEMQISSDVRRSGIGTVLMETLEAIARKWSMKKVVLTVFRNAISFYERLGLEMDPISPTKYLEMQQAQKQAKLAADTAEKEEGEGEDGWESESEGESDGEVDYEIYSKLV